MCEGSKGMEKNKQHNQWFKDHVPLFMWTTQVAILSKHVPMFVISKFYVRVSVMWFVDRVEPRNHLGFIQLDTRNSFKIYYCIWAAHLNLWTEKSTLPSNGSVKTDLLVVGKKCCCGLGGTSFSTQPSEIVEWINYTCSWHETKCVASPVNDDWWLVTMVLKYLLPSTWSWLSHQKKMSPSQFPYGSKWKGCLQYRSRTSNLIWWCLVIRYRGVEISFNHKRGFHIFEINDPHFQILVFTQGPFEVGYINFWWIFVKDTSSMGGETMKITILQRETWKPKSKCVQLTLFTWTCHIASPRKGQPAKQTPFKLFKSASGFDFRWKNNKKHPGIKGLKAKSPSKPPYL